MVIAASYGREFVLSFSSTGTRLEFCSFKNKFFLQGGVVVKDRLLQSNLYPLQASSPFTMPSTKATFNDEELVPDEISVAMSHGGGSTVSKTSSVLTTGDDPDNDEIIELVRGQCLVIFKRGGKPREVVCAGKYDKCQLKDHKALQRDDRNRSKPGWFRGVFTQKGRLIGGWLDSRMTATEAKTILEMRKVANRRAAGIPTPLSRGGETPSLNKSSPSSASTWDDCQVPSGVPSGKACVALGKQMTAETSEEPRSVQEVTETVIQQQRSVQKELDQRARIQVGDLVEFKRGRIARQGTIQEVYPDPLGAYYLLIDDKGTEVQVEETMITRTIRPAAAGQRSGIEVKARTEAGEEARSDPVMAMMDTLQQTLKLMQQKDAQHQSELAQVKLALQTLNSGATKAAAPQSEPSETRSSVWFAIAKGDNVGVYSFAEAKEKLHGLERSAWQRVQSVAEGWEFIASFQEQELLSVTLPNKDDIATSLKATGPRGDTTTRWYAVAKGRHEESQGVYTSWARAAVEVEGVSNACFKSFSSEAEANAFVAAYREQREVSSLQAALADMQVAARSSEMSGNPKEVGATPGGSVTEMGGRVNGPDPSQKSEGKIFGFLFTEETTLRMSLVPHPRQLAIQVQLHLLGQALDVSPLPYSVAVSATESSDTSAALSRALASMAGAQTDMELGGEPMDLNWKSGNKISVASIKTLTQLRERLSELRQGKRAVEQTLLGRISSVLQHAGYDATTADEWAVGSILYRIGCDSQYYYIQLHEHILGQAWEDESSCDFENAKLEIEHHAAELRRRRSMYSSRIMMICAVYAYLRDQSANNFQSSKLQEKRQKLAMLAMKKQMAHVESHYQKMKELSAKGNEGGNGNSNGRKNDKNKPMCWKCHQAGIHTGGKDNCIWKNLSDEEAKAKALDWVAAKQAQIGGNGK